LFAFAIALLNRFRASSIYAGIMALSRIILPSFM